MYNEINLLPSLPQTLQEYSEGTPGIESIIKTLYDHEKEDLVCNDWFSDSDSDGGVGSKKYYDYDKDNMVPET